MNRPGGSAGPVGLTVLAERAAALVSNGSRAILGIVGAPGSGKSTLAQQLLEELQCRHPVGWVSHIPMDGYHLADDQLRRLGSLNRKGAPDTFDANGYAHLLARTKSHPHEWIYVPGFDRSLEQPLAAALVVPPTARLIITEGNYLLLNDPGWIAARKQMDQVWFVSTQSSLRQQRLVSRHIQFGKEPVAARDWVRTVDEPNAVLVDESAPGADIIILNDRQGWRMSSEKSKSPASQ